MTQTQAFYRILLDYVEDGMVADDVMLGQTWTYCRSGDAIGLAMSPGMSTRTLPWAGTLRGRPLRELAGWVQQWDPFQSSIGMAAINCAINRQSAVLDNARILTGEWPANLAVFEHFYPVLKGKKVVVIGRYPQMDHYLTGLDLTVLEMQPGPGDLPPQAAETLLPEADWVFISATTIANKTFPRLAELAREANVVLMGPTVPWMEELADYGVDYLAGVVVTDPAQLQQTIAEGGGTRLFEAGARYALADLADSELGWLDSAIDDLASRRGKMIRQMAANPMTAPQHEMYLRLLARLDEELNQLERRHRQYWSHNNSLLQAAC